MGELLPETTAMLRPVLALVLLIHVPLALTFLGVPQRQPARIAAGALAVLAICLPPGDVAALASLPWFAYTAGVAAWTARQVLREPVRARTPADLLLLAAAAFLPVGSAWLVFSRYGQAPLGFAEPIVTLTAMHFHVAGFAAMIVISEMVRRTAGDRRARGLVVAGLGAAMGMPLVALGITFSKQVEYAAVALFVMSLVLVVAYGLAFRRSIFGTATRLGSFALGILAVAMGLAGWYGVGPALGVPPPTIPWMAATHGLLNAFGFAWPALWALRSGRLTPIDLDLRQGNPSVG